jgi:hypothetical protein
VSSEGRKRQARGDPTGLDPCPSGGGDCGYGDTPPTTGCSGYECNTGHGGCGNTCRTGGHDGGGDGCKNDTNCSQSEQDQADALNEARPDVVLLGYGTSLTDGATTALAACMLVLSMTYCISQLSGKVSDSNLGPHEKSACAAVGLSECITAADDANEAYDIARQAAAAVGTDQEKDARYQAIHHALWMALMMVDGIPAEDALTIARAHESDHGGFATNDSHIDMLNNYSGIAIGNKYFGMIDRRQDVIAAVVAAAMPGMAGEVGGNPLYIVSR